MQTNKSLAVKIRDTVFGETLKSSVEERDESRQNKLETVKLTAPLPPPSLRVVLIFVYRSIYRCVKFTPPVLSADVRAETEMAVMHARKPALNSWCARTGRTTNQATLFRFPLVHRAFFFLSFLFFFFSSLTRSFRRSIDRKCFVPFFCPILRIRSSSRNIVFENSKLFSLHELARFCLITRRIKSNFTQDHIS